MRQGSSEKVMSTSSSSSTTSSDDEGNNTVIHRPQQHVRSNAPMLEPASPSPSKKMSAKESDSTDVESVTEYLYGQNFYELRDECLKNKKLFEDPEFPPDNDLLRKRSERYVDDVEWFRPSDFIRPEDPILVSDRNEGFDIRSR